MELRSRGSEFSLHPEEHYLNCAYLSPISKRVEEAGVQALRRARNPAVIRPADFFEPVDEVRKAFADLIGISKPSHVAILPSVSYGMATVARNMESAVGKRIVLIQDQFPSDVYVWHRLAESHGFALTVVDRPYGVGDVSADWSQRIVDEIGKGAALACVPNVHWADGLRFYLEEISDACRRQGTYLIVDGSQSVGALPFDQSRIQADAIICAGYKWLTGPYGMALGAFGPRLLEGVPLEETWIARKNSRDFASLVNYESEYESGAVRYDVGERSSFTLIPMMREALLQIIAWQPSAIQDYCAQLTVEAAIRLAEKGFRIAETSSRCSHILGVRLPEGLSIERVRSELALRQVHVSIRSDAIRVSPNVYNSAEDMHALVDGILSALP